MIQDPTESWGLPDTAVMDAIERALADEAEAAVLATIVSVDGNAYRRPGAKMVVTESGGVGSVTAGCLEDEVEAIAGTVRDDGELQLQRFDLTGDDDVWGLGLGCNGVIDMLFEPLDEGYQAVIDAYRADEPTAVLTVIEGAGEDLRTGARLVARNGDLDGAPESEPWPSTVRDELAGPIETLLAHEQSETVDLETGAGTARVFVDAVVPPHDLVVFGSGPDVGPVTEFARKADFRVTVAAFRGGHADADRFPAAHRVLSTSPSRVREEFTLDEETATVVMTHNFVDDQVILAELLETPVPYIGLMGPEERFEELLAALDDDARALAERERDRLYAPIGLDLGGGAPYQIALSILAEVQAVTNGRTPGHLRDRRSPIHERVDLEAG